MSQRQMHLGVYAVGSGNHIAAGVIGRHDKRRGSGSLQKIAASCERGKLDFLFVGDSLGFLPGGHPGQ